MGNSRQWSEKHKQKIKTWWCGDNSVAYIEYKIIQIQSVLRMPVDPGIVVSTSTVHTRKTVHVHVMAEQMLPYLVRSAAKSRSVSRCRFVFSATAVSLQSRWRVVTRQDRGAPFRCLVVSSAVRYAIIAWFPGVPIGWRRMCPSNRQLARFAIPDIGSVLVSLYRSLCVMICCVWWFFLTYMLVPGLIKEGRL